MSGHRIAFLILTVWVLTVRSSLAQGARSATPYVQMGPAYIAALAVSPNSQWLATADLDGVRVYDLFEDREVRTLAQYNVKGLAFTNDADTLITAGSSVGLTSGVTPDFSIRFWNFKTGVETTASSGGRFNCLPDVAPIQAIALSRDGSTLAASCSGEVRLWALPTGRELYSLPAFSANTLAFSPDGATLVGGSSDTIYLWNYHSGTLLQKIPIVGGGTALSYSQDGSMLLIAGREGLQIRDGHFPTELRRRIAIHDLYTAAFSPDSKTLAIGSDLHVQAWDASSASPKREYGQFFNNVSGVIFSPDGRMLIAAGDRLKIWDTRDGHEVHTFRRSTEGAGFLALLNNRWLLEQSGDNTHVWDYKTGALKVTLTYALHYVMGRMGVRSNDRTLLALGYPGDIAILNGKNGQQLFTLPVKDIMTTVLAFRGDDKVLASGGVDGIVRLWDLISHKQLLAIDTNEKRMMAGPVRVQDPATMFPNVLSSLAFSQDGSLLAGVASNGSGPTLIRIWNAVTGREKERLTDGRDFVTSLAFDSTGTRIAIGTNQGVIRVWDLRKGTEATSFRGHGGGGAITALIFDSKGNDLISAAGDGQVKIWDLAACSELITMVATGPQDWLVFTPDGLFDGTAGAIERVGWRIGDTDEVVPIESFYNDFFHPGLYGEVAAGRRPKARMDIAMMLQIPGLRTMLFQNSARIETRDGRKTLCFRDKPTADPGVVFDSQPLAFDLGKIVYFKNDGTCPYRLSLPADRQYQLIDPRELSKAALPRKSLDGKASKVSTSTLYVQTIAIDGYPDASGFSPLHFSVSSAEELRKFFKDQSEHHRTLYSQIQVEPGLYEQNATAQGIQERLAQIAHAMKEQDVILLFLSGHGVVPWGQEMFFFAPWDMRGPDPELETQSGFSTAMLADALRKMPCLRVFIVIDACQSGGALESLEKAAQAKVVEAAATGGASRDSEAKGGGGMYIVASASPFQTAEQTTTLTASPMVAALMKALQNGGNAASAMEVANYIQGQAPKIEAESGGTPMVISTGVDFPLAWGR